METRAGQKRDSKKRHANIPPSTKDPMDGLEFWNSIVVPEKEAINGLPEELFDLSAIPPIIEYRSVMQNLQREIAMEHARKVKEGKESVTMNGVLREKYSSCNYHFPDRVLNAGLCKKDFTAPFLIDVKDIHQDMGRVPSRMKPTVIESSTRNGGMSQAMKRKVQHGISSSPGQRKSSEMLFDRLKQSYDQQQQRLSPKRIKLEGQKRKSVIPSPARVVPGNVEVEEQAMSINNNTTAIGNKNVSNNVEQNSATNTTTTEDDFFPRIVATVGSFQLNKGGSIRKIEKPESSSNQQVSKVTTINKPLSNGDSTTTKSSVEPTVPSASPASATAVRCSGFLGCRRCGKTFPSVCDHLFRSHMLLKHGVEVTDADINTAKIKVTHWHKCKKCELMVLNNLEEHHKRCLPNQAFEQAFMKVSVMSDEASKLVCGICSVAVESRVNLRHHLESKHPSFNGKILLDPCFRCAQCLQSFQDARKMFDHVKKCQNTIPSAETVKELTLKNLNCQVCMKKKKTVRETLFCYQNKKILRCVLCLFISKSRNEFFEHLSRYHGRKKSILCCQFCSNHEEMPVRQAFDHFIDVHLTSVALKRMGENSPAPSTFIRPKVANIQGQDVSSSTGNSNTASNDTSCMNSNNINNNNNNNEIITAPTNSNGMPTLTQSDLPQEQPTQEVVPITKSLQGSVPTPVIVSQRPAPIINPTSTQVIEKQQQILASTPTTSTTAPTSATTTTINNDGNGNSAVSNDSAFTAFTAGSRITRPILVNRGSFSNIHLPLDFPLQQIVEAVTSSTVASTITPTTAPSVGEDSILESNMDK